MHQGNLIPDLLVGNTAPAKGDGGIYIVLKPGLKKIRLASSYPDLHTYQSIHNIMVQTLANTIGAVYLGIVASAM